MIIIFPWLSKSRVDIDAHEAAYWLVVFEFPNSMHYCEVHVEISDPI